MQPTSVRIEQIRPSASGSDDNNSQIFPPLNPNIPRNFTVTDTYYENPPAGISAISYEDRFNRTANGDYDFSFLAPFRGLGAVGEDVKECLPAECRESFEEARAREKAWHAVRDPSIELIPVPDFCYIDLPIPYSP